MNSPKHNDHERDQVVYTCPMHPDIKQEKPGLCPECGMQLVKAKGGQKKEHQHHHGAPRQSDLEAHGHHSKNMFKTRFWVSLVLSVPIIVYSDIFEIIFGVQAPEFPGSAWIPAVLASIIFLYGGSIFITSAVRELRGKQPGMMTLIALASTVAYGYSLYVVISGRGQTLFWELATLITIMLLGHWMEMRAVSGAQSALKELSKLLPDQAEVEHGHMTHMVPLSQVKKGDIVVVKPGGKIPTDGLVLEGTTDVNESIITGESKPVSKQKGSKVIAGTINGDGTLRVQVTESGEGTFLASVRRLIAEAQSSKSRLQILSDRAAFALTLIAILAGGATLTAWVIAADLSFAVERSVAVLVIACPHALGLAIPLVASISVTKAARNGFLIRQRLAMEAARTIDVVLFDKTGTLTKGEFGVSAVLPAEAQAEQSVLALAASINAHSEHPIGRAIVRAAQKKGIELPRATEFKRIGGKGARAQVDGQSVYVGSAAFMAELGVQPDPALAGTAEHKAQQGQTIVYVIKGGKLIGALALADVIREESRQAIDALKKLKVKVAMLTGDSKHVAAWVASDLGLDEYFAEVLPEQKVQKVKALQATGQKVAMVGDGVNDAPALAQADLGIAIGAGTTVAIESAGIILVKNDPRDIPKIIHLSQLTYAKMIQNLWWAAGYNIVAIPLAAGVLATWGIFLQPAVGALFMSLSTVIVAFNALLLRKREI